MGYFEEFKTGSIFWLIFILLSFSGLIYLGIWGFHNSSVKAIAISTIFSIIIIFSLVITRFKVFDVETSFIKSCASYTWGFLLFVFIAGTIKVLQGGNFFFSIFSAFQLPKQSLFATISGELPIFWDKYVNNFTIPVAEELFWLIALPIGVVWILNSLAQVDKLSWLDNNIVQLIFIIIISSVSFAIFHVGSIQLMAFIISAIVFRSVLIMMVYVDMKYDIFPALALLFSFGLGAHQANNIMTDGLMNFIVVMQSNWFGVGLLFFMAIVIVVGILETIDILIPGFAFGENG